MTTPHDSSFCASCAFIELTKKQSVMLASAWQQLDELRIRERELLARLANQPTVHRCTGRCQERSA